MDDVCRLPLLLYIVLCILTKALTESLQDKSENNLKFNAGDSSIQITKRDTSRLNYFDENLDEGLTDEDIENFNAKLDNYLLTDPESKVNSETYSDTDLTLNKGGDSYGYDLGKMDTDSGDSSETGDRLHDSDRDQYVFNGQLEKRIPMGFASQLGKRIPMGFVSQLGKRDQLEKRIPMGFANQLGKRIPMGFVSQLGKRIPMGFVSQLGKRIPMGFANQLGKRIPMGFASQLGKRIPMGFASQLGKRIPMGFASQLGKRAPMSFEGQLEKRIPMGFASQLGKRIPMGFVSQLGKRIPMGFASQLGKRIPMGFASQLGKRIPMGFASQLGKRIPMGFASQLGKRNEMSVYENLEDPLSDDDITERRRKRSNVFPLQYIRRQYPSRWIRGANRYSDRFGKRLLKYRYFPQLGK